MRSSAKVFFGTLLIVSIFAGGNIALAANTHAPNKDIHTRLHRNTPLHRHINRAVTRGDLTQAQADALRAKRKNGRAFHQELQKMTPNERRNTLRSHRATMHEWVKAHGIPEEFLFPRHIGPRATQ